MAPEKAGTAPETEGERRGAIFQKHVKQAAPTPLNRPTGTPTQSGSATHTLPLRCRRDALALGAGGMEAFDCLPPSFDACAGVGSAMSLASGDHRAVSGLVRSRVSSLGSTSRRWERCRESELDQASGRANTLRPPCNKLGASMAS